MPEQKDWPRRFSQNRSHCAKKGAQLKRLHSVKKKKRQPSETRDARGDLGLPGPGLSGDLSAGRPGLSRGDLRPLGTPRAFRRLRPLGRPGLSGRSAPARPPRAFRATCARSAAPGFRGRTCARRTAAGADLREPALPRGDDVDARGQEIPDIAGHDLQAVYLRRRRDQGVGAADRRPGTLGARASSRPHSSATTGVNREQASAEPIGEIAGQPAVQLVTPPAVGEPV